MIFNLKNTMPSTRCVVQDSSNELVATAGISLHIQGVAKKRSPLQKWLTWFIMTINKENGNKSCVFVLYRYLCVRTSINCNSYLNIY